jgi:NADH-quinone oxidoreductase chain G
MVDLTIDGQEVSCPVEWTVYEAATEAGIHIPTFCHHEKLVPVGACRMCLVEIEGVLGLQTSCTTPVREGMVVKVHSSPLAVEARRANIEFLLTNHPLDCPVCDKGGECPLQDQALADGPGQSRYVEEKRHKLKRHPLSDFIVLDQERCVLCWRCIRFLDEWADDHELDLFGRGADTRLSTFDGRPMKSKWQGNTIEICPVGALTSRIFRFEARVWELDETATVCPLCAVGCNSILGVKNNELRRITPRENMEVNDAWLCDKGRFGHGFVDHAQRLDRPLIRRDGRLAPATWDEALDLIAGRFGEVIDGAGPDAIAGLGSTHVTNEANYLFQRFMRSMVHTNNVDHPERKPAGAVPLAALPSLEERDVVVLVGFDPSTEAPLVELWIKKAVLRHGAQVVVVNPWQIELGRYGGPWLPFRPGSGPALLNGLAGAVLAAGHEGRASGAANLDDFRGWLKPYDAGYVARTCGTPAGALEEAARLLAGARRPAVLYGPNWLLEGGGAGESGQVAAGLPGRTVRSLGPSLDAVSNLALLLGGTEAAFVPWDNNTLGALQMGTVPELYPGRQTIDDNRVRSRLASFWGSALSPVAGLDFDGMMDAGREGGLGAMWIMGADPAHNCRVAGEALGRIPFLVVQDLFLTETASLAEVVLPAASFAETEGSYTNMTGRIQAIRPARRPPGQARPDWQIVVDLARRMGDEKQKRAWDFEGAADVLAEISRVVPGYRGLSYEAMGETGWQPASRQEAARRAFVRVEPEPPAGEDADYPLVLAPGSVLYDREVLLARSAWIQEVVPDFFVMIHPTDAARLGLEDGDEASLVSAEGRLAATVRVSEDVAPGVAFAPRNLSDAPLSVLFRERWTLPRIRIVK